MSKVTITIETEGATTQVLGARPRLATRYLAGPAKLRFQNCTVGSTNYNFSQNIPNSPNAMFKGTTTLSPTGYTDPQCWTTSDEFPAFDDSDTIVTPNFSITAGSPNTWTATIDLSSYSSGTVVDVFVSCTYTGSGGAAKALSVQQITIA